MISIWEKYNSVTCICCLSNLQDVDLFVESLATLIGIDVESSFVFLTEMKRPKEGFGAYNDCYFISKSDLKHNGKLKNERNIEILNHKSGLVILFGEVPKRFHKLFKTNELNPLVSINSTTNFARINFQTNSTKPNEMLNFARNTLLKISD